MTEGIRNIFEQNIRLLRGLEKTVYYFRMQIYDKALAHLAESTNQMKSVIEGILANQESFATDASKTVLDLLSGILVAWKKKDYIFLADFLEVELIGFLCDFQELIISKENILYDEEDYLVSIRRFRVNGEGFEDVDLDMLQPGKLLEEGYRIEFTSSGVMTLAAENNGSEFYFHSNNRVYAEALLLATHWYKQGIQKYILYGFGMGYHISELLELAPEAELEVYESDMNVIQLASAFSATKDLLDGGNLRIIFDPGFILLQRRLEMMTSSEKFVVHYPSYQNIRNTQGRELLGEYFPWSKTLETF